MKPLLPVQSCISNTGTRGMTIIQIMAEIGKMQGTQITREIHFGYTSTLLNLQLVSTRKHNFKLGLNNSDKLPF